MAISPIPHSKRPSSKSNVKEKKMSKWEIKRNLAQQRLEELESNTNNGDSVDTNMPLVSTSPANDIQITSVVVSASPLERAEEVRANLPPQLPSFVKPMLKSHVSGGFCLGLPSKFCIAHLPKSDEKVILEDENGEEYDTKYLARKGGLSGGWRSFSIAHDLRDKDVLVFQLIQPCKFKVYIVRTRDSTEVDGARSLLVPISDQSGIRFSDSPVSFKEVNSFEDFNVLVDGLIIDSEIPFHLCSMYYELCRSQHIFLHENLMPGINTKLAAGMISETINIADAVRVAKPSTDHQNLERWDRTLKAFEDLGMVVGFLRDRIQKLLSLGRESRAVIRRKRRERDDAEEEMRCLRVKLSEVEKWIGRIDAEIEALEMKNQEFE